MKNAEPLREEFDLLPDPRVLPMLGEINLDQWRCIAELADNSVDSFLLAERSGRGVKEPAVWVVLPTANGQDVRISVRDNGPGMTPEDLERAVTAGFSGNDPVNYLGLFGMGFNIATARLGTVTTVWTTRPSDKEWCGLTIDFAQLVRQRHFKTPRLRRAKADPAESGTEVVVEKLKPEQARWFAGAANRSRLRGELARTYSAMLRANGVPISFTLTTNGTKVLGRDHCIWGGDENEQRIVQSNKFGEVDACQVINAELADRKYCTKCWHWLAAGEETCPVCALSDDVIERKRHVRGWLGLQRYLSGNEYGIDFLRNGRKIEIANKDLFKWELDGVLEDEYPVDDLRHRGRIVGEIHLDHCRVSYAKDRFDRSDPAWEDMIRIVRGEGPLRPDRAKELGFSQNDARLYVLFQLFRRSTPKPKIPGCWARLLVVPNNDLAAEMAQRFYKGEAEYQSDAKWWELVEQADRDLLTTEEPKDEEDDLNDLGEPAPEEGESGADEDSAEPSDQPEREKVPSLSRTYSDDCTEQRWEVEAWKAAPRDPELDGGAPWRLTRTPSGIWSFVVDVGQSVFDSSTMTPLDSLLAELAWSAIDFERGRPAPSGATFAVVLAGLREKYAGPTKLEPIMLCNEASMVVRTIAANFSRDLSPADSLALFQELQPAEQEQIIKSMAAKSVTDPKETISGGRFLEYASGRTFLRFFERHPELFFDGRCWDASYASLPYDAYGSTAAMEEAQTTVLRDYSCLLNDAVWLSESDSTDLSRAGRARLLRASLALELLSIDLRTDEQD